MPLSRQPVTDKRAGGEGARAAFPRHRAPSFTMPAKNTQRYQSPLEAQRKATCSPSHPAPRYSLPHCLCSQTASTPLWRRACTLDSVRRRGSTPCTVFRWRGECCLLPATTLPRRWHTLRSGGIHSDSCPELDRGEQGAADAADEPDGAATHGQLRR